MTIVSIYSSRCHDISENLLSALFQQLPKSVKFTGDFNSYHQRCRNPANDDRGCQVLSLINKNQLNNFNDLRHTIISGTSKSAIDLTYASSSLQAILSWNVADSSLSFQHCMITVNVQSKNSEPLRKVSKFNINQANWHLFTLNKAWKKVTNPNQSQSAEALTEDFY